MYSLLFNGSSVSCKKKTEEASEVMQDTSGRWFSFSITGQSYLLLEKKGTPEHLHSMSKLETVATVEEIMLELQDAGEVFWLMNNSLEEDIAVYQQA